MKSMIIIFSQDTALRSTVGAAFGSPYTIQWVSNPHPAQAMLDNDSVAALILDAPATEAHMLSWRLRASTRAPLITIIGDDDADARIAALRAGADDAISRPFVDEVLVARLKAKLRRAMFEQCTRRVESARTMRQTILEHRHLHLSPMEQRLLSLLRERVGAVVPFTELQHALWDEQVNLGRLRYHIHQLRHHLSVSGSNLRIEIARGDGYRLMH